MKGNPVIDRRRIVRSLLALSIILSVAAAGSAAVSAQGNDQPNPIICWDYNEQGTAPSYADVIELFDDLQTDSVAACADYNQDARYNYADLIIYFKYIQNTTERTGFAGFQ